MRRDYYRDLWTYIAPARTERTDEFRAAGAGLRPQTGPSRTGFVAGPGFEDDCAAAARPRAAAAPCDFCPGYEGRTPPEVDRIEGSEGWLVRVFDNKFPIVGRDDDALPPLVTGASYGRHEVVVETPSHNEQFADLTVEQTALVLEMYGRRIAVLSAEPGIAWVQVFKNHGPQGGASLVHSHSQIVATALLPASVAERMEYSRPGDCAYCRVADLESKGARLVGENEDFVAFVPFAPQYDYEVWIVARRHVRTLEELGACGVVGLATLLHAVLGRVLEVTESYNVLFFTGQKGQDLHLHLEVVPRMARRLRAGFELATGFSVVTATPEDMAGLLRRS